MRSPLKFGVVIPSFERLDYLKEAVESALNQSYKDLEILVVDDHSTNPALKAYLKSLASPTLRIIVNRKNLGTTANYDKCVRSLSPDVPWCVILDNDDILDRNFVQEAVEVIQKFPKAKALHARQFFIDEHKRPIGKDGPYPPLESAEDYLIHRCLNQREIRTSAMIFNVERFKEIGGYPRFPSGLGTDTVLLFAITFGNVLVYAPKAEANTRLHAAAESGNTKNILSRLRSIRLILPYCQNVYHSHPRIRPHHPRKTLMYLRFYAFALSLFVLVGRCKELSPLPPKVLRRRIRSLSRLCRKHSLRGESLFLESVYLKSFMGQGAVNSYLTFIEKFGNLTRKLLQR